MSQTTERYELDALRWFAADLATQVGMPPERAAALARLLLWQDTFDHPDLGLATLPSWLEKLETGQSDPKSQGRILSENPATAVLDASGGVAPLVLARAGEIASQKAREVGVGLVRVRNLGVASLASQVAAELAIGPQSVVVLGPDGSWALGVPSSEGLPLVLASRPPADTSGGFPSLPIGLSQMVVPDGEWTIQAISIPAFESVEHVHDRVRQWVSNVESKPSMEPSEWDARRTHVRDHGLTVDRSAWKTLTQRARNAGLPIPSPRVSSTQDRA